MIETKLHSALYVRNIPFDVYVTEGGLFKANLTGIGGRPAGSWVTSSTMAGLRDQLMQAMRGLGCDVRIPATLPGGSGQLLPGWLVGFTTSGAIRFRREDGSGREELLSREITVYRRLTEGEVAEHDRLYDRLLAATRALNELRDGFRIDHYAALQAAAEAGVR
ncbi:MAG TPA: hypothetical protein VH208_12880 [Myxococcaceae bacterium]|jgi:hypothetical protein|nr:hypothetical protein [Myxococcaceae bacterium]